MGPKADDLDRLDADEMMEESTDDSTVEVTRVQIEQTRGEMTETIDAIRDKLNPQTLAEQAKETVSEITSNVMEKAKETVHNVAQEAKATVHDVVQEAKETLPTLSANVAHQAVSGAVSEAKEAVGSAVSTARHAVGEAAGSARDAGATVMDMIRRNPIPAALIGIGLGWLWASNRGQSMATRRYDRLDEGYQSPYDESTWGRADGSSGAMNDEIAGTSYTAASARSVAREKLGEVKESITRTAEQVQESVGDLAGRVQGTVSETAGRVQESVGTLGRRAGDYTHQMAASCQSMIEERPLAVGAMALGLGAAIGMLIPGTYRENRLMGEARDQVVDKVQDTAQDLASRAQIVAEEAMDTATEEARNQGLAR